MTIHPFTSAAAVSTSQPMEPFWAEIAKIQPEAPGVSTYWLRFIDPGMQASYQFKPGQFNMLALPGLGEAAISISSSPKDANLIAHTIRHSGNVTQAISRLREGDSIGIRGPFGTSWPIEEAKGQDIIIAAGGIGLPPLRTLIYHILEHRQDYGRVVVLYGARTPQDLQFTSEYESWEKGGLELMITVDRADEKWTGLVGVVPLMFYRLRMDARKTFVMSCGPEIMLRFVVFEALARRIPVNKIIISMERNMKCALGFCGHCQIGPFFVCKDGPVFTYEQLQPYFNVEDM